MNSFDFQLLDAHGKKCSAVVCIYGLRERLKYGMFSSQKTSNYNYFGTNRYYAFQLCAITTQREVYQPSSATDGQIQIITKSVLLLIIDEQRINLELQLLCTKRKWLGYIICSCNYVFSPNIYCPVTQIHTLIHAYS